MSKIAKIMILAKNSNFHRMAGSVWESDIWPEMSPWGVLEPFCTRNRHLIPFRSNFKKNQKIGFWDCLIVGDPKKWGLRIFYGSENGSKKFLRVQTHQNSFPQKMSTITFPHSLRSPNFVVFPQVPKNTP